MKKVVNILTMTGCMFFGAIQTTYAQDVAEQTFHQLLKQRFIEGGPFYGSCSCCFNSRIGDCH